MKILIAIDKFKGSLTSQEAACSIKTGICNAGIKADFREIEIADGGEGSFNIIKKYYDCTTVSTFAHDPLGRKISTEYLLYRGNISCENSIEKSVCAFIEMAKISGLTLLSDNERNPLRTTTYGLGELIGDAVLKGAKKINVSIGGSATNDGGTGMLQALGYKFFDINRKEMVGYMCGGNLCHICAIDGSSALQELQNVEFNVICDVDNPLCGRSGATYIYGSQKGAGEEDLKYLENGMNNYIRASYGINSFDGCINDGNDIFKNNSLAAANKAGAGAAGGLGYAMNRFLQAKMIKGWKFFADVTDLERNITETDLVISGEGKIDEQSFSGKVVNGVLHLASKYSKPVMLFCGVGEYRDEDVLKYANLKGIYQIRSIEKDIQKSISNASDLLMQLTKEVFSKRM